jgi:hypothetical protein
MLALPRRKFRHFQHGEDIVFHAQFPEYAGFLRQVTDTHLRAFVHGQFGNILVIQENTVPSSGLISPTTI